MTKKILELTEETMACQTCEGKGLVCGYGDPETDETVRWDMCSRCNGTGVVEDPDKYPVMETK